MQADRLRQRRAECADSYAGARAAGVREQRLQSVRCTALYYLQRAEQIARSVTLITAEYRIIDPKCRRVRFGACEYRLSTEYGYHSGDLSV